MKGIIGIDNYEIRKIGKNKPKVDSFIIAKKKSMILFLIITKQKSMILV